VLNGGHAFTFPADEVDMEQLHDEILAAVPSEIIHVKHSKGEFFFRAELFAHMSAEA
jgi:hypothetical protein